MASDANSSISKASRRVLPSLCFGNEKSTPQETLLRQHITDSEQRETDTDGQGSKQLTTLHNNKKHKDPRHGARSENKHQQESTPVRNEKRSLTKAAGSAVQYVLRPIKREPRVRLGPLDIYQLGALGVDSRISLGELGSFRNRTADSAMGHRNMTSSQILNLDQAVSVSKGKETRYVGQDIKAAQLAAPDNEGFMVNRIPFNEEADPQWKCEPSHHLEWIRIPVLRECPSHRSLSRTPETRSRWGQTETVRNDLRSTSSRAQLRTKNDQHTENGNDEQALAASGSSQGPKKTNLEQQEGQLTNQTALMSKPLPPPPMNDPDARERNNQRRQPAIAASLSADQSSTKSDPLHRPSNELPSDGRSQSKESGPSTYHSRNASLSFDTGSINPKSSSDSSTPRTPRYAQFLDVPRPSYPRYPSSPISPSGFNESTQGLCPHPDTYVPLSPYSSDLPGPTPRTSDRRQPSPSRSKSPAPPRSNRHDNHSNQRPAPRTGVSRSPAVRSVPRQQPQLTTQSISEAQSATSQGASIDDLSRSSSYSSTSGYDPASQPDSPLGEHPPIPPCLPRSAVFERPARRHLADALGNIQQGMEDLYLDVSPRSMPGLSHRQRESVYHSYIGSERGKASIEQSQSSHYPDTTFERGKSSTQHLQSSNQLSTVYEQAESSREGPTSQQRGQPSRQPGQPTQGSSYNFRTKRRREDHAE